MSIQKACLRAPRWLRLLLIVLHAQAKNRQSVWRTRYAAYVLTKKVPHRSSWAMVRKSMMMTTFRGD